MKQTHTSVLIQLVVLLSLILGGCSSIGVGSMPREFVIESKWVRSTLKKEFLGFRRMNRMTPLVLETMIIQANSIDGILAYDRVSGAEIWRLNLDNGVEGGAQSANGKLYFGSSDGQFYCLNTATGKVLWTFPVRAETLAPPTVEGGVVYFQSGTDVVYALDAETGRQLWLYNRQVAGNLSIRASTRPMVAGDTVFAGFSDGFVVALKKRDGGLLWERKLGRGNRFKDVDSTPVIDGSNVYVASFDGSLSSLKADSGEVNWTLDEGGYVPVTIHKDRLYFSTTSGKVLILDKTTGQIQKTIQLSKGIATQPVIYKTMIIYGESEGGLVVADAESGASIGRFEPGRGLVSRPAVVEQTGEAYFISNNANLFALKMGFQRIADRLPWQN